MFAIIKKLIENKIEIQNMKAKERILIEQGWTVVSSINVPPYIGVDTM